EWQCGAAHAIDQRGRTTHKSITCRSGTVGAGLTHLHAVRGTAREGNRVQGRDDSRFGAGKRSGCCSPCTALLISALAFRPRTGGAGQCRPTANRSTWHAFDGHHRATPRVSHSTALSVAARNIPSSWRLEHAQPSCRFRPRRYEGDSMTTSFTSGQNVFGK